VARITWLIEESFCNQMMQALYVCPVKETIDGFLSWLADLPLETLEHFRQDGASMPKASPAVDLERQRFLTISLISEWNELYFASVDPVVLAGLQREAEVRRLAAQRSDPADAVEAATQGVRYEPKRPPECVLLVPQWHFRPWNIYGDYGQFYMFHYPADAIPAPFDDIPLSLLRLTRALGDESRLRMLRSLAEQSRSFTDLVTLTGLSKSTVNHHTVMLRAAGLITVHVRGGRSDVYSLREQSLLDLDSRLRTYLHGGGS
jgi:DNA-binding transcriptional ArsR family regulator